MASDSNHHPQQQTHDTPAREQEIEALRQNMMKTWWLICLGCWIVIGLPCLWWIRADLIEIAEYFTWAAVRSIFLFQRVAGTGVAFCIAVTFALLVSESRQIIWGISPEERTRLVNNLDRIHAQGPTHPQWKIISKSVHSEEG